MESPMSRMYRINHLKRNKGPSEKGTTLLQRTPMVYFRMTQIHFDIRREGQPPYKGQNGWLFTTAFHY